ncbi:MAG: hypothetical protein P4L75_07745, partial [Clostridia bacterium]|nr:hypothetical protein [Clostridia bacterium]
EDNVTVQSQKNGTIWYFRRYQKSVPLGGALLFEVDTYSQAEWKALSDKSGLIRALEDNESVYAVRLGNVNTRDDGLHLPESEVLQRLRLYTPQ